MKVLLINSGILSKQGMYKSYSPPLGILYIAGVLIQHGHKAVVIDCDKEKNWQEAIGRAIFEFHPNIIGISALTETFVGAVSIANLIKSIYPEAAIVLGGMHVTYFPEKIMQKYNQFDYAVVGEGEYSFLELVEGGVQDQIRGVYYRKAGAICYNGPRPPIKDLDQLPLPARELVSRYDYTFNTSSIIKKVKGFLGVSNEKSTSLITSRGCVYKCRYCANSSFRNGTIRFRSAENVIAEVGSLVAKGYRKFVFVDDHFTTNPRRAIEICQSLVPLRKQYGIGWLCMGRGDIDNDELYKVMAAAGCKGLLMGIESGSPSILHYYRKKLDTETLKRTIRLIKKYKIDIIGSFILGADNETFEHVKETACFLKDVDIDFLEINKLTVFPGTDLWQDYQEKGMIDPDKDWEHLLFCHDVNKSISKEAIRHWARYIKRQYYLRPSYVVRQVPRSVKRFVGLFQ